MSVGESWPQKGARKIFGARTRMEAISCRGGVARVLILHLSKEATTMLRIKDIMTKAVYTVEADASAEEAAWGLTRRHIGGAPVRDGRGNLVGVLSKGDLVNPEPSQ